MSPDEVKKVIVIVTRPQEQGQPGSDRTKEVIFKGKYCGKDKPLDEMGTLRRVFPPAVASGDYERQMR